MHPFILSCLKLFFFFSAPLSHFRAPPLFFFLFSPLPVSPHLSISHAHYPPPSLIFPQAIICSPCITSSRLAWRTLYLRAPGISMCARTLASTPLLLLHYLFLFLRSFQNSPLSIQYVFFLFFFLVSASASPTTCFAFSSCLLNNARISSR